MVREAKRQPNNRQASGLVPGWLNPSMLRSSTLCTTRSWQFCTWQEILSKQGKLSNWCRQSGTSVVSRGPLW
jgi:hypothetical protein